MDTTGEEKIRAPKTTWRRTAVTELEEMGPTWGEAQKDAQDPEGAMEASRCSLIYPTGGEED